MLNLCLLEVYIRANFNYYFICLARIFLLSMLIYNAYGAVKLQIKIFVFVLTMALAVIDIGSNVARSVVYSDNSICAREIYHERFKVDLRSLLDNDDLSLKHPFYAVLNRFLDIFAKLEVTQIKCVATAILRNHPKADKLCQMLQEKYQINVEILTGQQEAFLSSCGLLMGSLNPNGIIADLGGGSLELAEVHSRKLNKMTSLPLGTQILSKIENLDQEYVISKIKEAYCDYVKSDLYLIGGGFRIIAKSYIEHVSYPLYNIHNLEIPSAELLNYLEYLQKNWLSVFTASRSNDMYSVIVLQSLVEIFQPDKVLVSNYGLKEGIRYISLPQEERYKDLIWERCKTFVGYQDGLIDMDSYTSMAQSILKTPQDSVDDVNYLIKLSLLLLQSKKNIDRNFHSHFVSHAVLMADIPFTHKQRASLALIMSNVFGGKPNNYVQQLALKVLRLPEYKTAIIIAKILSIALVLDGPELVKKCSFSIIEIPNNKFTIKTSQTLPYNLFNYSSKQLKSITKIITK